jgi:hypothetical protein
LETLIKQSVSKAVRRYVPVIVIESLIRNTFDEIPESGAVVERVEAETVGFPVLTSPLVVESWLMVVGIGAGAERPTAFVELVPVVSITVAKVDVDKV